MTINGERFEISTQRYVEHSKWASSAGKVRGNSEEARTINQYLDSMKQKVYEYQRTLGNEGHKFSKEMLRRKWYGIEQYNHTLVQVFTQHNDQMKALIGKDNSKATYTKYRTTVDHTIAFYEYAISRFFY